MDLSRARKGKFASDASTIMETMNSRAICSIVPYVHIKTFWKTLILRPNRNTSEYQQHFPHKLEFHSN